MNKVYNLGRLDQLELWRDRYGNAAAFVLRFRQSLTLSLPPLCATKSWRPLPVRRWGQLFLRASCLPLYTTFFGEVVRNCP